MGGMTIFKNTEAREKQDSVEYGFDASHTLWVAGSWTIQKSELTYFESNIWYRKTFNVENILNDNRYFIDVGASNLLYSKVIHSKTKI